MRAGRLNRGVAFISHCQQVGIVDGVTDSVLTCGHLTVTDDELEGALRRCQPAVGSDHVARVMLRSDRIDRSPQILADFLHL